jgi:hypothetical protein
MRNSCDATTFLYGFFVADGTKFLPSILIFTLAFSVGGFVSFQSQ